MNLCEFLQPLIFLAFGVPHLRDYDMYNVVQGLVQTVLLCGPPP